MYEAVLRIMTPEQLDGRLMFITAALGFGANIVYVEKHELWGGRGFSVDGA